MASVVAGTSCGPARPPGGNLLRVHTEEYLRSLRSPEALAGILEVPVVRRLPGWVIDWRILRPTRSWATRWPAIG